MVAVASYLGVSALLSVEAGGRRDAAERARMAERLALVEHRLAELEKRPELPEAMDDDAVRQRLQELVVRTRQAERQQEELRRAEERSDSAVRGYRWAYDQVLSGARSAIGADDGLWQELLPLFDRHFEPVAKQVRESTTDAGGRWRPVRVNISEAVAAALPDTLGALRQKLPGKAWESFDAWRRQPETGRFGLSLRAEYFLPAAELAVLRVTAAAERRWRQLQRALPGLIEDLKLDVATTARLEALIQQHAERFTAALDGQLFVNVNDAANRERIRQVAAGTDAEVRKLLGDAGFETYSKWKARPESNVYMYFGIGGAGPAQGGPQGGHHEDGEEPPARRLPDRMGEVF
jgi:hypothetical protein